MNTYCVRINHKLRVAHKHLPARNAAHAFEKAIRLLRMSEIPVDSGHAQAAEKCRQRPPVKS